MNDYIEVVRTAIFVAEVFTCSTALVVLIARARLALMTILIKTYLLILYKNAFVMYIQLRLEYSLLLQ